MAQTPLITRSPIWDTVVVLAAGVTGNQINVFSRPQGQNDEAAAVKTKTQTSLTDPGRLPEPESFDVSMIQCFYLPGTKEADILLIEAASYLEFYVAGTQIRAFECPKAVITSGTGLAYGAATALAAGAQAAGSQANWGYPSPHAVWTLEEPIQIGINETFQIQLKFNGLSNPSANTSMRWVLRGTHYMVDQKNLQGQSLRRSA